MEHQFKITAVLLIAFFIFAGCGGSSGDSASNPSLDSSIIMIGDSYFAMDGYIADGLESFSGKKYRHYYMNGTGFTSYSYGIPIDLQYDLAKLDDSNIKIVIMDGGGNDIRNNSNDCPSLTLDCTNFIDDVIDVAEVLVNEMYADNVENIIYLYYPNMIDSMDYINPMLNSGATAILTRLNNNSKFHFIDLRIAFNGHPEYFKSDDLHPTKAGGDVAAGLIWDVLKNIK